MCGWLGASALLVVAVAGCVEVTSAESIDLSAWKITLPVDEDGDGKPDEILQPELATFTHPETFFPTEKGDGLVFRAHCGGFTSKNSSYPRSELREMEADGQKMASWSTDDEDLHVMTLRVAVTGVPRKKPHVVCAQIHDADDDLVMVRLEGTKLFVERNEVGDVMLDKEYQLGTPIDLKIEAGKGHVKVFYNGEEKFDWEVSRKGCYFKAGCYTQSNVKKGDNADAYGEVTIYALKVRRE